MVSHFLEIRLTFCFFFWMIGELVRTSPWRFQVALDGPEFDNFWWRGQFHENFVCLFFFPEAPGCILMDGWMYGCVSEGVSF